LWSLKVLVTKIPISNKTAVFSGKFETKQPTYKNVPIGVRKEIIRFISSSIYEK